MPQASRSTSTGSSRPARTILPSSWARTAFARPARSSGLGSAFAREGIAISRIPRPTARGIGKCMDGSARLPGQSGLHWLMSRKKTGVHAWIVNLVRQGCQAVDENEVDLGARPDFLESIGRAVATGMGLAANELGIGQLPGLVALGGQDLVRLLPGRAVEVTCEHDGQHACSVAIQLADLARKQLGAFQSGLHAPIVKVRVDRQQPFVGKLVAELDPRNDARQTGVPTLAAHFVGRLRKPKRPLIEQLVALFAKEYGRGLPFHSHVERVAF